MHGACVRLVDGQDKVDIRTCIDFPQIIESENNKWAVTYCIIRTNNVRVLPWSVFVRREFPMKQCTIP